MIYTHPHTLTPLIRHHEAELRHEARVGEAIRDAMAAPKVQRPAIGWRTGIANLLSAVRVPGGRGQPSGATRGTSAPQTR